MEKKIHFEDIEHIIRETLGMGKSFKISPNGGSMLPLIVQGRDSVYIKSPVGRLKKYDIAFYKRDNGKFVLHRVVKVKKDSYVMCGDNQLILEEGVKDRHIIGVVCKLECNGKTFSADDKAYKRYVFMRVNTRFIRKIKNLFQRATRKIKRILKV